MRLGEVKQKIDYVLNKNDQIELESISLYGNQVYRVENYKLIIDALKSIEEMDWNIQDFSLVQEVINSNSTISDSIELSSSDYNKVNTYISSINSKIPLFISMLRSVVDEQDEKVINIKLPDNVNSLEDLNKLNSRLSGILKLYNLDGQFEFKSFDKGTDWYVVLALGKLSYWALVGGLNIANKFFDTRKTYYDSQTSKFNSKTAKLEYKAATNKSNIEPKELEDYVKRKLDLQVEQDVNELSERIDETDNSKENLVKILKATQKLIQELETDDFEFHLSLNPPKEIVSEVGGKLSINYENLPTIKNEKGEVKKIQAKEKVKNEEEN